MTVFFKSSDRKVIISDIKIIVFTMKIFKNTVTHVVKVRKSCNDFFQADDSSKKLTNEFNFTTTMIPQFDLFPFIFGRNWIRQKDISKLTDLKYILWILQARKSWLIYCQVIVFHFLQWKMLWQGKWAENGPQWLNNVCMHLACTYMLLVYTFYNVKIFLPKKMHKAQVRYDGIF